MFDEGLVDELHLFIAPMALAGGGTFRTVEPTRHTLTNIEVLKAFLDASVNVVRETRSRWRLDLETGGRRVTRHSVVTGPR